MPPKPPINKRYFKAFWNQLVRWESNKKNMTFFLKKKQKKNKNLNGNFFNKKRNKKSFFSLFQKKRNMYWKFLFLCTTIFAFECSETYQCFQTAPKRVWVLSKLAVKNSCEQQCLEAGSFYCNIEETVFLNTNKVNRIVNGLGFQCSQGPCVGIEYTHITASWPSGDNITNRFCYYPTMLYNDCSALLTEKNTSECFNHHPSVSICLCSPLIEETEHDNNNFPRIIPSFTMNGTEPVNANACANTSACAVGTTCTDVNLTTVNVTNTSCICNGNECLQITNPPVPGSSGKYNCARYTTYTSYSQNWTSSLCSLYVQENGAFRIGLLANLPSQTVPCRGNYRRWFIDSFLEGSLGFEVYHSVPSLDSNGYVSASQLDFTFGSCVTNQGCSEVLSCGNNSQCLLQPNSCLANTALRLDTATNLSGCHVVPRPLFFTRCPPVGGQECLTAENSYLFTMNGKFTCTSVDSGNCVIYRNLHLDTLFWSTVLPQLPSNQCQDSFQWSLSNGTLSTTVNTSDPRLGPTFADFPPSTFENCTMAYFCSSCPNNTQGSGYTSCDFINGYSFCAFLCLVNNGGCDRYASCIYHGNGTHSCGPCSAGFQPSSLPCTTNNTFTIFRVNTRYANSTLLTSNDLTFGIPMSIVSFNGSVNNWLLNPGPNIKRGVSTTTTGLVRFELNPEPYTMFSYPSTAPLTSDGFGAQFVNNYTAGQDLFITLFFIRRSFFTIAPRRVIVLTWESKDEVDAYTDLDLTIELYSLNVPPAGCIAPCCLTNPTIGLCGTMRVGANSNTSDNIEQAFLSDVQPVFVGGGFYSYFIYAALSPAQQISLAVRLKRSNAQLRIYSTASARNADVNATFAMTFSSAQMTNPLFAPAYWPIVCMIVGPTGTITYRNLKNSTTSAFSAVVPVAATWCT